MRTRTSAKESKVNHNASVDTIRNEFVKQVEQLSAQDMLACYECEECVAGCPAGFTTEYLPSELIQLIIMGAVDKALDNSTIWFCTTCPVCVARCPKGVDLSRIMAALRRLALDDKDDYIDYNLFSPEELAEFSQEMLWKELRHYIR
jgi:heterodisulfide reductase subunit C